MQPNSCPQVYEKMIWSKWECEQTYIISKSQLLFSPAFKKQTKTSEEISLEDSDAICFWKGFWKKKMFFLKMYQHFHFTCLFWLWKGKGKWKSLGWLRGRKLRVISENYQKMHICGLCSQPFKPLGNGHSWWEAQKPWFSVLSAFRHMFIQFVEKVALSFSQWTLLATHWIMTFFLSHFWKKKKCIRHE